MKSIFFALSAIVVAISVPAFSAEEKTLQELENSGKLSAIGMCDQFRSALVEIKIEGEGTLLRFMPVADSHKQFFVLKKKEGEMEGYRYFVRELSVAGAKDSNPSGMEWWAQLMPMSPSFINYVMFPDKQTDCSLSPTR